MTATAYRDVLMFDDEGVLTENTRPVPRRLLRLIVNKQLARKHGDTRRNRPRARNLPNA